MKSSIEKLRSFLDDLLVGPQTHKVEPRPTIGSLQDFTGKECALALQKHGASIMGGALRWNSSAADVGLLALIDILVRKGIITADDVRELDSPRQPKPPA